MNETVMRKKGYDFERRERESDKAFAAFEAYLRMGSDRTVNSTAEQLKKSRKTLGDWSGKHDWASRADAYDTRMAEIEHEMTEIAVRASAPVWLERTETLRERSWATYEKCLAAAEGALARFVEKGKDSSLGEIARMLEVATKLGCLATGLAADRVAVVGGDGGPVKVEFLAALERAYGDAPALGAPGGEVVDVEIASAVVAAGDVHVTEGAVAVVVAPAAAARLGAA